MRQKQIPMIPRVLCGSPQTHDSDDGSKPEIPPLGTMSKIPNGQGRWELPIAWMGGRWSRNAQQGAA